MVIDQDMSFCTDEDLHNLVKRWAPINYQYINLSEINDDLEKGKDYDLLKQDLVVSVNLDFYKQEGDENKSFDTQDVRNRLKKIKVDQLTPAVYYSIAITENHYYILYSFFHANDTTHPNDMEGCLVILERNDDQKHGMLLGLITVAHTKYPKYIYDNRLQAKNGKAQKMFVEDEIFDSGSQVRELHALVQQESGKHGMYGLGNPWMLTRIWRWLKSIIGLKSDIIVYYPGKPAKNYELGDLNEFKGTTHYATFYYDLVDILHEFQGLYHRAKDLPNSTFEKNGQFHGTPARSFFQFKHSPKANPPWKWEYDGISIWDDPAMIADTWFVTNPEKPFLDKNNPENTYIRKMNGDEK